MGLEAKTLLHTEGLCFEINALLESDELIIRGPYKMRAKFSQLQNISAQGDELFFDFGGDSFRLELGENAQKWHKKIISPPKPLHEKLGLKPETKISAFNNLDSVALNHAISANLSKPNDAQILIAQITSKQDIESLIDANSKALLSVWLVNVKGKNSPFNENQIREIMRANLYIDIKTCAIDDVFSGTFYKYTNTFPQSR